MDFVMAIAILATLKILIDWLIDLFFMAVF